VSKAVIVATEMHHSVSVGVNQQPSLQKSNHHGGASLCRLGR
jgi:hypothetical protein